MFTNCLSYPQIRDRHAKIPTTVAEWARLESTPIFRVFRPNNLELAKVGESRRSDWERLKVEEPATDGEKSGIAILILAHKNPLQTRRLVEHLDHDFDVFVHIDRRSKMRETDFLGFSRTAVVKKFRTTWGSLGIVRATLELFHLAAGGHGHDRYVLISAQDVPLMTNQQIISFFARNRGVDYLEMNTVGPSDKSVLERITTWHFFRKSIRSWGWLQKGPATYLLTRLAAGFGRTVNRLFMASGMRRPMNFAPFYGSQWMDLRAETVENLLQFVRQDPRFLNRFRFTHAPDEFFFQTAIGNCGARPSVARPQRIIDWDRGPEHPRVLRLEDLPRLESSTMMFARKFDDSIDADVINKLYARLRPPNTPGTA